MDFFLAPISGKVLPAQEELYTWPEVTGQGISEHWLVTWASAALVSTIVKNHG